MIIMNVTNYLTMNRCCCGMHFNSYLDVDFPEKKRENRRVKWGTR